MANLAVLFVVWAFFFLLGGAIGFNLPLVLLVIGSVLHLLGR